MEAIELFNSSEYALTGGIYSQSQDDIDFLLKFLRAGNIYVNRPNTGARVAIEPFGGFILSGTGPKAGGPDYLQQFHCSQLPVHQENSKVYNFTSSSGYELMRAKPSLISIPGRLSRFTSFSSQFIQQYEQLVGHVNELEKQDLNSFSLWIKDHLQSFLTQKHSNFLIPGQLSYNDKSLVKDSGLFVVIGDVPSYKLLTYFFAALSLGSGISVACLTADSYRIWKGFLDLAWKSGFSKTNLDISLVDEKDLSLLLKRSEYSYVYADELYQFSKTIYQELLHDQSLSESMRLILSDLDGNMARDPSSILDLFVWTRSFAINTMRHGAPLEVGP
jgi:RHH-type proline utilization regulon transcriptional repressor/proline dehydrogenase/delta 1-pyrroline-5-carboxylate dehydrogenase